MRADRLLSLIMLLQTRGKQTAEALAEALHVSRRTILRDVEALSYAGIPVYAEGGRGGGIGLDEDYRTALTGLHTAETLALLVSSNASRLGDVGLGEASEGALLKLLAALPASQRPSVEHLRQRLLIDPDWWWHEAPPATLWDVLQQAVYEDRRIEAVYENHQGEQNTRVLEPYSLVAKSSLWYLIARREGEFRTYRVARLREIVLRDEHFVREPGFDLPSYWREHTETFAGNLDAYLFILRVHPEAMDYIRWVAPGRSEILDEGSDDNGWLRVRIRYESVEYARMIVFGLGKRAAVLEPASLRDSVLHTARELLMEAK